MAGPRPSRSRAAAALQAVVAAAAFLAGSSIAARAVDPTPSPTPSAVASGAPSAAPSPSETPEASPAPGASGLPLPPVGSPVPTFAPSPSPSPTPAPVALETASAVIPLGHEARVRVLSPPSGVLLTSVSDPSIVRAVFDSIDRRLDLTGLHAGSTDVTVQDQFGQNASLGVSVEPYAGHASASAQVTITGDPASASFVSDMAVRAATRVAYPVTGATLAAGDVAGAHTLAADESSVVHVPLSMSGPGLYPYHQTVDVRVDNIAQPMVEPKYVLVSDFPETITENGTLFYADVNFDEPVRLLYYHYAATGAPLRRVLVKVQNNGLASSLLQLTAGIGGPDPNVLAVGHDSTKRFLVAEAAGEGQIFEVPPHATINIVDQLLPAQSLVSGLMQVRVVAGDGVRLAIVVQDAADSPTEPISDTLLSSAVRHARGVYQVPTFFYDESYTVGDAPTVLSIGKLPLPNMVQGEVLGGDYGVKQTATMTLLNPGSDPADVRMWLEPRGGRATATFLIDGDLAEVRATNPATFALVRTFTVPAHGFRRVEVVTMPEGGSSYPVNVLFSSNPPD